MSFNILTRGINLRKKEIKKEKIEDLTEKTEKVNSFPDLRKEKKQLNILYKKLKKINDLDEIEKLKSKKIESIMKKIEILKDKIKDELRLTSNIDDLPLCSFEEIEKKCKLKNGFSKIVNDVYKFVVPSPIQSIVIPLVLKVYSYLKQGNNIIATSDTGSGKTLSYIIPIIHSLYYSKLQNKTKLALIILPTKELCMQIYHEALIFSKYYTDSNIHAKYVNKGMIESIQTNFTSFLNNNNILVN